MLCACAVEVAGDIVAHLGRVQGCWTRRSPSTPGLHSLPKVSTSRIGDVAEAVDRALDAAKIVRLVAAPRHWRHRSGRQGRPRSRCCSWSRRCAPRSAFAIAHRVGLRLNSDRNGPGSGFRRSVSRHRGDLHQGTVARPCPASIVQPPAWAWPRCAAAVWADAPTPHRQAFRRDLDNGAAKPCACRNDKLQTSGTRR